MMENLPTKHRMWIVTVITYSPNYIVFTGIFTIFTLWTSLMAQILLHSEMFYQCVRPYTVNYVKFLRMTTSIISYGLVFNLEKLSGSPYLNTIIVGSLRYSINLVCAVVDVRFVWAGRRLLHGVAMSFISACLGLVFVIVVLGQLFHFQDAPNYVMTFDRNEL
uniref:Serpentine receptor class gamma n=1 Tax=Parascaris equorum TaxID=6256 RepID=A0A914R3G0_PAREQ